MKILTTIILLVIALFILVITLSAENLPSTVYMISLIGIVGDFTLIRMIWTKKGLD